MKLPTFESYGNYSSSNYGAHALVFYMPNITVWFSYKTPIAFRIFNDSNPNMAKYGLMKVRVNDWSTTTGRHLNAIDGGDKKNRISGEQFERELSLAVQGKLYPLRGDLLTN